MSSDNDPYTESKLLRRNLSAQRHATESSLSRLEAESISEALPEGFPDQDSEPRFRKLRLQKPLVKSVLVATLLNIACGSLWGVLARKGLIALTTYPGSFLGGLVWANFIACYVMGMAIESERFWVKLISNEELASLFAAKGSIPLYVGVTTGFCGSCSSFSSLILEMFNKAANLPPSIAKYPNSAFGILGAIEVVLTHLGLSLAGYRTGRHFIRYLELYNYSLLKRSYYLLELISSAFGAAGYIIVIVLIATKSGHQWREWTLSCLFAPWGSFLRYFLSRKLNPLWNDFPLGTYTANLTGTILLGTFNLLTRGRKYRMATLPIVSTTQGCYVLSALDDGFCGCLTTVSTFMVELCALTTKPSYIYGTFSVVAGFICMLLVLGPYNWVIGFVSPVC